MKERTTMIRKTILMAGVVALAAATAQAQDPRVELSGTAGWTFSDGVNVGSIDDSPITIGPKDAFSWGARIGFMVTPNVEIGGLFNLQSTDLEVEGFDLSATVSQKVYNYHGYLAYNFGESDASVRPYVLGGLGATQYGGLDTAVATTSGETQFSSTWAAGLKIFPGRNFGIRLEGRWTPTYIKSDPEGYWCDPYWGCYTVAEAEYSNQFELSGGITLRF
jgi:hypothetical protein